MAAVSANRLTGPNPAELVGLTSLEDDGSDFQWNALFTPSPDLEAFITGKQTGGDWQSTQTVAPAGLAPGVVTETTVELVWPPIPYSGDDGRYEIEYATASLMKKLLHNPSVRLREAAEAEDDNLIDVTQRLFGIDDE